MKQRNPTPHRQTEKLNQKTRERIEQYYGKVALLNTWEAQSDEVLIANHDYIIRLRANVRKVRAYILHRAGPDADLIGPA